MFKQDSIYCADVSCRGHPATHPQTQVNAMLKTDRRVNQQEVKSAQDFFEALKQADLDPIWVELMRQ